MEKFLNLNIKNILLIYFIITSLYSESIKKIEVQENQFPKEIKYKGVLIKAIKFEDKKGKFLFTTSHHDEMNSSNGEDFRSKEIFAQLYSIDKNLYKLEWKIFDFVKDCNLDIQAEFFIDSIQFTDLNQNGIAEIWMMYKTGCFSDVSPLSMKLIMFENKKKYAMRGQNRVKISDAKFEGGAYKFDKSFEKSPIEFKNYAIKLWNKNLIQKW